MFVKVISIVHAISAFSVAIMVLGFAPLVEKGLTIGNQIFDGVSAKPFVNNNPYLLKLFASAMISMGVFDVLTLLYLSRPEVKKIRCLVGLFFNGGNALLALHFRLTSPSICPGYVYTIVLGDGLFSILYLIAFFLSTKPKKQ